MIHCPECNHPDISIINNLKARMGFATKLALKCSNCKWTNSFFTSNKCESYENKPGQSMVEVNVRNVIAFREIGKGHQALTNYVRCMNMNSLSQFAYTKINERLHTLYETAAQNCMKKLAKDIKESSPDVVGGSSLCHVAIDGSWQKRGHASLVTATNNGKSLDVQILSKHCRGCQIWERKKSTPDYDNWFADHSCDIKHTKSFGAMESAGAVAIFSSSVEKYNLIYNEYLGDGDRSSFKDVVESEPYKEFGVDPIKLECISHVQKRVGTRLRNLVKKHKGTSTPVWKRQTYRKINKFYAELLWTCHSKHW